VSGFNPKHQTFHIKIKAFLYPHLKSLTNQHNTTSISVKHTDDTVSTHAASADLPSQHLANIATIKSGVISINSGKDTVTKSGDTEATKSGIAATKSAIPSANHSGMSALQDKHQATYGKNPVDRIWQYPAAYGNMQTLGTQDKSTRSSSPLLGNDNMRYSPNILTDGIRPR
jgi:hypothetical protein